jgi:hypothetical protein
MGEKYNTHRRDENAYKKFGSESLKFNLDKNDRMAFIRERVRMWADFVWPVGGFLWTCYELQSSTRFIDYLIFKDISAYISTSKILCTIVYQCQSWY